MTATPIPRTLAMTLYGDLDVSVVDEMPPGRKPVMTRWLKPGERKEAYEAIRAEARLGRQAYVVYALVEESEKTEWKAATQMAAHLQKDVFPEFAVGLLHGQMKPEEKDEAMARFQKGDTQILVSTTVIEVGVDVPNATLMLVEDADRFGLAQLHQLRGRVGRGNAASSCYLVGAPSGEEGRRRLEVMEETNNGFLIAEEDLRLRGPGEFLGLRQSGLPDLKLADLLKDQEILVEAKKQAEMLIGADPKLGRPEHAPLLKAVTERFAEKLELGEVG
jgi:ATP-dependent DNA helicase RecG